jgi:hypothetical protein
MSGFRGGNASRRGCRARLIVWHGRRIPVSLLGFVFGLVLGARATAQVPGITAETAAHAVVNVAELASREPASSTEQGQVVPRAIPFLTVPGDRPVPPEFVRPAKPMPPEAALGLPSAAVASPSPVVSFEALRDQNVSGSSFFPPDTMGAAGPNHLMVTLNSQVRIQDRSGIEQSIVSLENFWAGTGSSGAFDPKLTYDPFGGRWIFTAVSDRQSAGSSVLIGASQTSDPTGTWNLFRFDADAGNTLWADYPSLGFNKDWVLVTENMFTIAGNVFGGSRLFLFRKSALYDGTLATTTIFNEAAGGFTLAPAVTYDNSLATLYLADGGWSDGTSQFLRISKITGVVGLEVFTECVPPTPCPAGTGFVNSGSNWDFGPPGGTDFAPQLGSAQKIQNGDGRVLNMVYRGGSLWVAHNVFLPAGGTATRTAAQWWQFTPAFVLQQAGRVDDATGTVFYAYPSIAVNSQSDVLLGFSIFSAAQYASGGYAFRFAADAANTLRDPVLLKAGEASYFKTDGAGRNRWGDFSATVVDPVNDLDFWTIQEYAETPETIDRWGTWWGKVSPNASIKQRRGQTVSD